MALQDEKIKWVEGTPFMVDGFRFTNPRCRHYFLTHFHSDHTTGLYKSFSAGTIYASQGTANLVTALIGVNPKRVVALPMNKQVMVAGFEITLVDANHCPAAVMFIIRDPNPGGRVTCHTGDFRADSSVCTNPIIKSLRGRLDSLYLDTTYCGPRHAFPEQQEVLAQAAILVRMELRKDPNTLFLVGTYSIGKEKVLEAVAKAAGSRCLVTSRKARIMRLSGAWDDTVYTTHDAGAGGVDSKHACVHAVPLQVLHTPATLLGALAEAQAAGAPFTSVVGVRPTGWTHHNTAKEGEQVAKEATKRARALEIAEVGVGKDEQVRGGSKREATKLAKGSGLEKEPRDLAEESSPGIRHSCGDNSLEGYGDDLDDEAAAWGAGNFGEPAEGKPAGEEGQLEAVGGEGSLTEKDWKGEKPRHMGKNARVHSLPYSEHSSYPQLKEFVRTVRPKKIVPTVNASSGPAVEKLLKHFLEFMDLSSDRKRLDSYFCKSSTATPSSTASRSNIATPSAREVPLSVSTPVTKRIRKGARGDAGGKATAEADLFEAHNEAKLGAAAREAAATVVEEISTRRRVQQQEKDDDKGAIVLLPPPRLRCVGAAAAPTALARAATAAAAAAVPTVDNVDIVDMTSCSSAVTVAATTAIVNDVTAERETYISSSSMVEGLAASSIDVEAQKAILADIERRNRLQSFQPPLLPPPQEERSKPNKTSATTTMPTVLNPYATPPVRGGKGGSRGRDRGARKTSSGASAAGWAAKSTCDDENRRPMSSRGKGRRGAKGRGVAKSARAAAYETGRGVEGDRPLGKGGMANKGSAAVLSGNSVRQKRAGAVPGAAAAGAAVGAKRGGVMDGKRNSHPASPVATIRDFFGRI